MRSLITLLVGLVLALGLTGPASAATTYPIPPPDASVSDSVVEPGEDFTFFAEGFLAGSPVTVTVTSAETSQTFNATANAQGRIALTLNLDVAGTYSIEASGVDADGDAFSVSSTVLVAEDANSSGGGDDSSAGAGGSTGTNGSTRAALARTGVDNVATLAWAGFGVLVLGGLLVTVATGRRRGHDLQDA